MVKGILDIITPPTKIKKTVYAQTYTHINTYYLYLLLTYWSIPHSVSVWGFFLALKIYFSTIIPIIQKAICIDFLSKIIII